MTEFKDLQSSVKEVDGVMDLDGFLSEVADAELSTSEEEALLKNLKKWSESDQSGFESSLTLQALREDLHAKKTTEEEGNSDERDISLSNEEKQEAKNFLEKEDVLYEIDKELSKEIVGEQYSRRICFLSLTSALLENKIHLRMTGPSGGGKSHILNTVSTFFPEEMFALRKTRVSPTYFEYSLQGQDLDGKVIQVQEWEGAEGAEVTLRPLLSGDQDGIEAGIVDTGDQGEIEARELKADGQPVFQTASTQLNLDKELETRTWRVEIDASEDQTHEVLRQQAHRSMGYEEVVSSEKELVKNSVRVLSGKIRKVRIPYAEFLADAFPKDHVRLRRDFRKVLAMIEAHTFLNQYRRPRVKEGDEEYILAAKEDYEAVREIAQSSFGITVKDLDSNLREVYDHLKNLCAWDNSENMPPFEADRIATDLSQSKSTIRKRLGKLADKGYVDKEQHPDDGRKNVYKVSAAEKEASADLPTFRQVLDPLNTNKVGVIMKELEAEGRTSLPSFHRKHSQGADGRPGVFEIINRVINFEEVTSIDIRGLSKIPKKQESGKSREENLLNTEIRLISESSENNETDTDEVDEIFEKEIGSNQF